MNGKENRKHLVIIVEKCGEEKEKEEEIVRKSNE